MRRSLPLAALLLLSGGCGLDTTSNTPQAHRHTEASQQQMPIISKTTLTIQKSTPTDVRLDFVADSDMSGIDDIRHFQFYLDTDDNASTGYSDGPIVYAGTTYQIIGADYMIEDGRIYKSASRDQWKWTYLSDVTVRNDDILLQGRIKTYKRSYTIPTALFGTLSSHIRVSVEPLDANYSDTNNFIPTVTLTLQ